jgi:hypothetical protein
MNGPDAFQDEMRRLLLGELGVDPFALDGDTADRLLAGRLDPADAPLEYAGVAVVLAAAAGPPTPGELAGGVAAAATGTLSEPARRMADSARRAAHRQPARSAVEWQDPGKVRSGGEGRDGAASVGHPGVSQEAYEGRSGPAAPTGPDATGTARGGQSAVHLAGRDGVNGRDGSTTGRRRADRPAPRGPAAGSEYPPGLRAGHLPALRPGCGPHGYPHHIRAAVSS